VSPSDTRWLDRDRVLTMLANGAVAILATDTVPGLHARIDRPRALARLSEIKDRPLDQSYVVLCADADDVRKLAADLSFDVRDYLDRLWPGPFSTILVAAPGLPDAVVAAAGTVAVRVPDWDPLRELLRRTGPLASTSVNRSGHEAATDLDLAAVAFPFLPVWQEAGPAGPKAPSTLVDLTGERPVVVRPGSRPLPDWSGGA